MKITKLFTSALIVGAGAVILSGCGDDDLTSPVITLNGDNPAKVVLGGTYVEPVDGYTATDNEDGDLTSSVITDESDVNTDEIGKYEVFYSVNDKAGNPGTKTRDVWVHAVKTSYTGTYSVSETCSDGGSYTYDTSISPGSGTDEILVNNFGGYGTTVNVLATISGDLGDVIVVNYTTGGATFTGTGSLTEGTITTMKMS
ncbi:MAG TPA: immunoglobulin-like domain-containing protein, partial [Chitinophagales bacterium]|nr:immunoglobulin-like domain-containing protein [Chitinophagales bacterium]